VAYTPFEARERERATQPASERAFATQLESERACARQPLCGRRERCERLVSPVKENAQVLIFQARAQRRMAFPEWQKSKPTCNEHSRVPDILCTEEPTDGIQYSHQNKTPIHRKTPGRLAAGENPDQTHGNPPTDAKNPRRTLHPAGSGNLVLVHPIDVVPRREIDVAVDDPRAGLLRDEMRSAGNARRVDHSV
jgi:hypothetical protein